MKNKKRNHRHRYLISHKPYRSLLFHLKTAEGGLLAAVVDLLLFEHLSEKVGLWRDVEGGEIEGRAEVDAPDLELRLGIFVKEVY